MNTFGAFYYSQEHENMSERWPYDFPYDDGESPKNFFKPLIGKVRQYNEWVSRFPFLPATKWGDLKFVGFGFYHHSERR
jgi:hypothetical protein